jgi:hypothetical protein
MRDPQGPGNQGIVDYATAEDRDKALRRLDKSEFRNPFDAAIIRVAPGAAPGAGDGGARRLGGDGRAGAAPGRGDRRPGHRLRRSPIWQLLV